MKILPLGGLGEIGKNMTMIEYGRNQIIVDCGVGFPESDLYGIDLVLPEFKALAGKESSLRGIVLTHGHRDHIGGIPYLLEHVQAPIYGTALTVGMVRKLLEQATLVDQPALHVIGDGQTIHLGPFRISPFAVAHSIPGAVGLVIDTPVGAIVHTGDYKLDETPTGGRTTDLERLRQLTPNGVLVMLGDSTNADRPGRTPTERLVADTLNGLFADASDSRIIIATFASVLARIQEIMTLAQRYNRKILLAGRSMQQNVELARDLGYLDVPAGLLVEGKRGIPDHQLLILSTGSQGEPRSALNLMAQGQHRQVHVKRGDVIIVSGGTIPGNEEDVARMLNGLFKRGAHVVYGPMATVHVSGHGSQEDMRIMLEAVRPRFLIPVHGEARHLHLHARLAQGSGLKSEDVFLLQNGSTWVSDGSEAWLGEPVPAGDIYVDGALVGDIGQRVIRERERLAQDGFVAVYLPVDRRQRLVGEPLLSSHGFVHGESSEELMDAARAALKRELGRNGVNHGDAARQTLQHFFFRKTHSRPVILPSVVRV